MAEQDIYRALETFVKSRDWEQFHTMENLSKSISIESAELLELFQWGQQIDRNDLADELADVLTYCYLLAKKLELSPESIILNKLEKSSSKYPVDKSKGLSTKYDRL
jgi:NTP pyrophosphatase (non-canonical NTP hydrolase)